MAPDGTPWYVSAFDAHYPLMQTYEDAWTEVQAASVEVLLDLPPGARILDLACGYGRHSRTWREAGHRPAGLDLSPPLLRLARERAPGGRWARGDMRGLPFRAGAFDAAALLFASFGYFETRGEDTATLREIRRVLRPGGSLFVASPCVYHPRATEDPDHINLFTPRQLETELRAAGFRSVSFRLTYWHPFWDPDLRMGRVSILIAALLWRLFPMDRRVGVISAFAWK